MQWSDIPRNPSKRTLRQFAGLCIIIFGGFACWQWLMRGNAVQAAVWAALAAGIGPLGLIRPGAIRWLYVGWMIVAFPIGWTISQILLAALFYGLITPVGLAFRLLGRDALNRRRPAEQLPTYWQSKQAAADARSYLRQF